ncbi:MAG: serine hydrolase [Dehalococcoidia bacterium]|nr:serine hydrolase [Dehalococcoidia bacterium]
MTFPINEMDTIAREFDGRMGFFLEDVTTGETHEYASSQRYPTASVCKITVMAELFRQDAEGILSLDDRKRLEDRYSTHGSGQLKLMQDEPEITLRDYCRMMITISDNMATDLLMETVGIPNINAFLDRLRCLNTRTSVTMGRYHYRMTYQDDLPTNRANDVLQVEASAAGANDYKSISYSDSPENNVAAPGEMGSIMKRMYVGTLVSPEASSEMLEMMKNARDDRMIRRDLPREIIVAQKSGSSGRIKGNVGIVYLPSGPMIVSAFATANSNDVRADEAIAKVCRLAYSAFCPEVLASVTA